MGKYGIGARVRDEDGDEGVIVGKRKGERLVRYTGCVGDRSWLNGAEIWWAKRNLTVLDAVNDDTPAYQPKVGDRVRVTYGHGWDGDGVVEAEHAWIGNFSVRMPDGRLGAFPTSCLEPLPIAAEAQGAGDSREDAGGGFKAGDRIRLVKSPLEGMPLGSEFTAVSRTSGNAGSVHFKDGNGDYVTWRPGDYFELVKPLTIEAGKFYRTRHGQRVGPAARYSPASPAYPMCDWVVNGVLYQSDGTFANGATPDLDLVAEWVDEPAVKLAEPEPVAVAPATATPIKKRDLVTLARSAMVTGFDPNNPAYAHVVLGTGGAYTLPVAALVAAA